MNNATTATPCVFLVDDDPFILRALERILSCGSYHVQACSSAEDFLASADLQQAGCIVLDLSMPAMSGSLLQEHLLRCESLLPVIFLTGDGD
ncbi:MAG: response regulator, partial [Janthinobacterium sp.]